MGREAEPQASAPFGHAPGRDQGVRALFPPANISQRATVIINKKGNVAWVKVEADITQERNYFEVQAVLDKMA